MLSPHKALIKALKVVHLGLISAPGVCGPYDMQLLGMSFCVISHSCSPCPSLFFLAPFTLLITPGIGAVHMNDQHTRWFFPPIDLIDPEASLYWPLGLACTCVNLPSECISQAIEFHLRATKTARLVFD